MLLQRKSKEMALLNKKSLRAYGYFMSPGLRVSPSREKRSFVYAIEGRWYLEHYETIKMYPAYKKYSYRPYIQLSISIFVETYSEEIHVAEVLILCTFNYDFYLYAYLFRGRWKECYRFVLLLFSKKDQETRILTLVCLLKISASLLPLWSEKAGLDRWSQTASRWKIL